MCTYRSVQKLPCWCRFGHSETRIFKETAWCKNWNEVAMSRGADVGGLFSQPTDPATTWAVFCTLPMLTLMSSLTSSSPLVSLTTICLFVLSIKVLLTSTSLIYSSSPIITSLSAIAFTKSMYLLMPECLAARSGVTSLILDFIQQLWQPPVKILDFSPLFYQKQS